MFEVWKNDETQSLFSSFNPNTPAWKTIQNSCCFLLQTIVIPVGEIWEIYDICIILNYGLSLSLYPVGLQDGSFKGFFFHASPLSFYSSSQCNPVGSTQSNSGFFFLWQLCRSKEEALWELILCQAALAVALISSQKSLGLAEDSATDKSWSPDLPPASLIIPGPLKYLGASSFLSRWWRDSAMEEWWSLPLPQIMPGLQSSHSKSEGTV